MNKKHSNANIIPFWLMNFLLFVDIGNYIVAHKKRTQQTLQNAHVRASICSFCFNGTHFVKHYGN